MFEISKNTVHGRLDQLQACMNQAVREQTCAGVSLLVTGTDGELCYLESGMADLDARKPIARDNIFRCYSMTKPVTACAVMMLTEQGKLDFHEPVSRYIPSFRHPMVCTPDGPVPAEREILIRDLMDMTAGLAYDGDDTLPQRETKAIFLEAEERFDLGSPMTTQEFAERIGQCQLLFHPGHTWNYSVCADVLGAVVEKAADMPFADFVRQRIFLPLSMNDSGFDVPDEKRQRLVTTYQRDAQGKLVPYTGNHLAIRNNGRPNAFHSGGAGMFSTIDDYARFGQMLIRMGEGQNGSRILKESTVRWMTSRRLTGLPQQRFSSELGKEGSTYTNLFKIVTDPSLSYTTVNAGEYGWGGWLGTRYVNDPANGVTILMMLNHKDLNGTFMDKLQTMLHLG